MKLEEFNNLSDEEKSGYLESVAGLEKSNSDLTAERDSFKKENDSLRSQLETNTNELKATKELNFTLARKIDTKPAVDPETKLYNILKEFR